MKNKRKFYGRGEELIKMANEVLSDFYSRGFTTTVRSLFYQLVSRNVIANTEREYKNLGTLVKNARLNGRIPWKYIVDETRPIVSNNHWDSPQDLLLSAAEQFRVDLRASQHTIPEVWVEKTALIGVLKPICSHLDVKLLSVRGNPSITALHEAEERIIDRFRSDQVTTIFYLGDHDPTGIAIPKNIGKFLDSDYAKVMRIGLNIDQVNKYNLPPNPAKESDNNYKKYAQEFGPTCWELDALDPDVIIGLVKYGLDSITDWDLFHAQLELQELGRQTLRRMAA